MTITKSEKSLLARNEGFGERSGECCLLHRQRARDITSGANLTSHSLEIKRYNLPTEATEREEKGREEEREGAER